MSRSRRWVRWVGWGGAILAVVLLVGPFLLPLPDLDTVPPRQLGEAGDRFTELDGIEVRYRESGSGDPTFLLLHGFGASSRSWDPIVGQLSALGRVIAFDRVGFGLTERPLEWDGDSPYGATRQVALSAELLDELEVDRAIVVGHSAGAEIAIGLASSHPDRVSGLVLESPALGSGPGIVLRALAGTPQGERVVRFIGRRAADRVGSLLESAYHDPAKVTVETLDGYLQPFAADDWDKGLAHLTAAPGLSSARDELRQLEIPVLVITGDDDTWVPTSETVELAGDVTGAELVVVPSCGHVSHEECPAAFMEAVAGWLPHR